MSMPILCLVGIFFFLSFLEVMGLLTVPIVGEVLVSSSGMSQVRFSRNDVRSLNLVVDVHNFCNFHFVHAQLYEEA